MLKDVAGETAQWFMLGRTRPAFESFPNGLNCLCLLDSSFAILVLFTK